MKFRLLAVWPWLFAALVLGASIAAPAVGHAGFAASYGLAAAAGLVTAWSFSRRDRLRWAWLLFGVGYLIGFITKLSVGESPQTPELGRAQALLWSALVILQNLAALVALGLFAQVWNGTGLVPPWRRRATLIFVAVALLIDGPTLLGNVRALAAGEPRALGYLASTVADVASIGFVGPILATAVAMRGGLLLWPWAFLFGSCFAWLLDDAAVLLPPSVSGYTDLVCRMLATQLGFAAALAQRWVTQQIKSGPSR